MNRQERRAAKKREQQAAKQASSGLETNDVHALLSSALAQHKAGNLLSAEQGYIAVLALRPDMASVHNALGAVLNSQGRHEESLNAFEEAIALEPGLKEAHDNRANTLGIIQGNSISSEQMQPMRIESNDPTILFNHGNQLKVQGHLNQAAETFAKILQTDPKHAGAYANLGGVFMELRNYDSAIAMCQASLLYGPDNTATYNTLGTALLSKGDLTASIAAYEKGLSCNSAHVPTLTNLGNAYKDFGLIEKSIETYRKALTIAPKVAIHSNIILAMHYTTEYSAQDIFQEHRLWNAAYAAPLSAKAKAHHNAPDPDRPLKVAMVSGSFMRHPVGYMTIAALEALSRDNLHLTLYSNTGREDDLTTRFRATADDWQVISGLNDDAFAEKVRSDNIDILIDLAGHSDGFRLLALARKPTPVQAKWVGGQFNTTGMEAMDYFISDNVETPKGVEPFYTEEIIRLPNGYVCYDPPFYAPDVSELPAIKNGYITFGCFNNLTKVNETTATLWAKILEAIPNSRLVLKSKSLNDEAVREKYLEMFTTHGIDRDRIDLRGSSPHEQLLAEYGDIDIALDPFPYSGGLTTVEALWMGVPVITMPGDTFAARHAASHLSNVGLTDWICGNEEAYVDLAIDKAQDLNTLGTLRTSLRDQVARSPLCDAKTFAQDFNNALRTMWRTWCSSQN